MVTCCYIFFSVQYCSGISGSEDVSSRHRWGSNKFLKEHSLRIWADVPYFLQGRGIKSWLNSSQSRQCSFAQMNLRGFNHKSALRTTQANWLCLGSIGNILPLPCGVMCKDYDPLFFSTHKVMMMMMLPAAPGQVNSGQLAVSMVWRLIGERNPIDMINWDLGYRGYVEPRHAQVSIMIPPELLRHSRQNSPFTTPATPHVRFLSRAVSSTGYLAIKSSWDPLDWWRKIFGISRHGNISQAELAASSNPNSLCRHHHPICHILISA